MQAARAFIASLPHYPQVLKRDTFDETRLSLGDSKSVREVICARYEVFALLSLSLSVGRAAAGACDWCTD